LAIANLAYSVLSYLRITVFVLCSRCHSMRTEAMNTSHSSFLTGNGFNVHILDRLALTLSFLALALAST